MTIELTRAPGTCCPEPCDDSVQHKGHATCCSCGGRLLRAKTVGTIILPELSQIQRRIVHYLGYHSHLNQIGMDKPDMKRLVELGLIEKRTKYTYRITPLGKHLARQLPIMLVTDRQA